MEKDYVQSWKSSLGNEKEETGKLYLYRKIKQNFVTEPYLKQVKSNKHRRAVTAYVLALIGLKLRLVDM